MAKFKQEILEVIKADGDLFNMVAKAMSIKPVSMAQTLDRNGSKLNEYSIVKMVAEYLKKDPEDLVEESEVKEQQS